MTFAARPLMSYGPSYSGTMTQGQTTDGSTFNILGRYATTPSGSMSPTTLSDGSVISDFYDETISGISQFAITIAADPGANYFTQITGHGTTKTSASRGAYSYSGGRATWNWNTLFGFASSGTTAVTVE